jgi:hypothetical protein
MARDITGFLSWHPEGEGQDVLHVLQYKNSRPFPPTRSHLAWDASGAEEV